ncbi:single-stranded-DNA-specific exonuclease RecJ [Candidatus Daviesbacteria bacterium]|nr:single-stranded-DNA-specific exonuclease RecJ [Candidatus Daviesbacteria bacterium]
MQKIWKVKPKQSEDILEQLLINRNIAADKEKQVFFDAKLDDFEKELQISGILKAQKRIKEAIEKQELIVIYGDYDVDGISASAICYKALTSIGAKVLPYIPHREKEGYGLSETGLMFARDSGASLVITVDNGIVAINQAKYAKDLELDLIITDHHLPLKEKPQAYSIIHSTKMCGAAVAWCLVRGVIGKNLAQDLLQFVAIATVCDLMPLIGLGRVFLKEGLKALRKTDNLGLRELAKEAKIDLENVGSYEIGHILGPRLNAVGRLEHAIDALRLLCTKHVIKAKTLAKLLSDTNKKRQQLTLDAVDEAKLLIDKTKKVHILSSQNWSQGIIGLVAGRVCGEYYRPAIAISVGESISKGSARSVAGLNIVEIIRECKDLLIDVGGHSGAAGFSLYNENLKTFIEKIEGLVMDLPDQIEQVLEIDAQLDSKKITKSLINKLEDFEPFGFGNPRPLFVTERMQVSGLKTVGEGKHLKFRADNIDAIGFGVGEWKNILTNGQFVDLVYNIELNRYNGFEKIQLMVKDLKVSDS